MISQSSNIPVLLDGSTSFLLLSETDLGLPGTGFLQAPLGGGFSINYLTYQSKGQNASILSYDNYLLDFSELAKPCLGFEPSPSQLIIILTALPSSSRGPQGSVKSWEEELSG